MNNLFSTYLNKKFILLLIFVLGFSLLSIYISKSITLNHQDFLSENKCKNLSSDKKPQCWSDLIDSNLKKNGVESTFKLLSKIYNSDLVFAANCHAYAHQIGKAAYEEFAKHKDFAVSKETSFCGFGFYHAFMETLLQTSGNLKQAREFCAYVDQQLSKNTKDAGLACYHGIGHGTVDFHNPQLYKNELDFIKEPIELCKKVSANNIQLNRCASGIFNAVAIEYNNGKLSINKKDPLWLCKKQENDNIRIPCYEQMNTSLIELTQNNFLSAAKYIEAIKNDHEANLAMDSLAGWNSHFNINKEDFDSSIKDCQSIKSNLRASCIKGFAVGLAEFGAPGKEYIKPIMVCKNKLLLENQTTACYLRVLNYLNGIYNKEKMRKICDNVDIRYKYICPVK